MRTRESTVECMVRRDRMKESTKNHTEVTIVVVGVEVVVEEGTSVEEATEDFSEGTKVTVSRTVLCTVLIAVVCSVSVLMITTAWGPRGLSMGEQKRV